MKCTRTHSNIRTPALPWCGIALACRVWVIFREALLMTHDLTNVHRSSAPKRTQTHTRTCSSTPNSHTCQLRHPPTHTHTRKLEHPHTCPHIPTHAYTHTYHISTHIYIHTHIYPHIHLHTHTPASTPTHTCSAMSRMSMSVGRAVCGSYSGRGPGPKHRKSAPAWPKPLPKLAPVSPV